MPIHSRKPCLLVRGAESHQTRLCPILHAQPSHELDSLIDDQHDRAHAEHPKPVGQREADGPQQALPDRRV